MGSSSWLLASSLLLLGCLPPLVPAFYVYNPDYPTVKSDHVVTIGHAISRAFAWNGPTLPVTRQNALSRVHITRRALPAGVVKRVNGLKIDPGSIPTQSMSAAIDEDGTDYSYFAEVALGSSGKTVYMLLDTGAANTWIMGSDCDSEACTTHSTFGPSDSTTLEATTVDFDISYGTGDVSGHLISDTLAIAGLNLSSFSFGSASVVSDQFNSFPMDGLLGLGRFQSSVTNVPTFMEAVATAKLLPANLFGINLQRASDGATDGEINFGVPDSSKYIGDLTYTDTVAGDINWEIPLDDALVNGTPCKFTGKSAVLDTGTTYMLIPPNDAQTLFGLIPGSVLAGSYWNVPCDATTTVELVFSTVPFSISPEDYVGSNAGGNMCQSHIIPHAALSDNNQWLLGDTFLKNVYSVYDVDNNRIGLGAKNPPTSSSSSASASPAPLTTVPIGSSTSTLISAPSAPPSSLPSSGLSDPAGLLPGSAEPASSSSTSSSDPGTGTQSTTAAPDTTTGTMVTTSPSASIHGDASSLRMSSLYLVLLLVPSLLMSFF